MILALEQLVRQAPRRSSPHGCAWAALMALASSEDGLSGVSNSKVFAALVSSVPLGCSNDDALRNVQTVRALVTVDLRAVPDYPGPNRANSRRRVGQAWLRKWKRTRLFGCRLRPVQTLQEIWSRIRRSPRRSFAKSGHLPNPLKVEPSQGRLQHSAWVDRDEVGSSHRPRRGKGQPNSPSQILEKLVAPDGVLSAARGTPVAVGDTV